MATAKNNVASASGVYAASNAPDCTHYTIWNHATNRVVADNFLQDGEIAAIPDPAPLALGEKYEIPVNMIVFTQLPSVRQSEEMARRALRGQVRGGIWVDFHTRDSTNTKRAGLINITAAAFTEAEFTIA